MDIYLWKIKWEGCPEENLYISRTHTRTHTHTPVCDFYISRTHTHTHTHTHTCDYIYICIYIEFIDTRCTHDTHDTDMYVKSKGKKKPSLISPLFSMFSVFG